MRAAKTDRPSDVRSPHGWTPGRVLVRFGLLGLLGLIFLVGGWALLPTAFAGSAASGPVEQVQMRTATAKVFKLANGDFQAEIHSAPIHYQASSGTWEDIDPSLIPSLAPGVAYENRAAAFSLHFAPTAAAEKIVTLNRGNPSVAFGLADASPLALAVALGDSVTYGEVLPGVDLSFVSLADGVKEQLVLKRAPLAPMSFRFPLSLVGLSAALQPDGSVALIGGDGKTQFVIPHAWMQDSSSSAGAASDGVSVALSTEQGKQVLTLTPDVAWLQDPGRVYPVTIDPTVQLGVTHSTYVRSDLSSALGDQLYVQSGSSNGGATIARTLVDFDLSSINGTHIISANLGAGESGSYSCTASPVGVYRITSSWSASTVKWATQPSIDSTALSTVSAAKGYSSSCPAGTIDFGYLTNTVTDWASGVQLEYGLELRAGSESDSNGWKQFRSNGFVLTVTYNNGPSVPTNLNPPSGTANSSITPSLVGMFSDPNAGASGHLDFEVYRRSDNTLIASGTGNTTTSGHPSGWTVPAGTLTSGAAYYWRARANDGTDVSKWAPTLAYIAKASCPGNPPQLITAPTISSSAGVGAPLGATLSATTGAWDTCGATSVDYAYQWFRFDGFTFFVIPDATDSAYTVTSDDIGARLYVEVTAYVGEISWDSVTSVPARSSNVLVGGSSPAGGSPEFPFCALLPPTISTYPVLSGTNQVGQMATTSTGVWSSCGLAITGYTFQWFRDGSAIQGATQQSYTFVSADQAHYVKAQVTAYNSEGPSVPADSNAFLVQAPSAPECSDLIDNDNDNLIDYPADPGCTGPSDDSEADTDTGTAFHTDCAQLLQDDTSCGIEPPTPETAPTPVNFGGYVLGWGNTNFTVQGVRAAIRGPTDNDFRLERDSIAWERVSAETHDHMFEAGFGRSTENMHIADCRTSPHDKKLHLFWFYRNKVASDPNNREHCSWFDSKPALPRGASHLYTVFHKLNTAGTWQMNVDSVPLKAWPSGFAAGNIAIAGGQIQGSGTVEILRGPDGDVRACFGCSPTPVSPSIIPWQWTSSAGAVGWTPVNLGAANVISAVMNDSHNWQIDPGPNGGFYVRHFCQNTYGGCGY